MSEIMKITDERETQTKKSIAEKNEGDKSYSDRVRAKWFCCEFKLSFPKLTCKASLIFKSNLELALSITLKEKELHDSKHVTVEYRSSKLWDLLSFFICSSI